MRSGTVFGMLLLVVGAASCAQILGDDFQVDDDEVDDDSGSSSGGCDQNDCSYCLECACNPQLEACSSNFECTSLVDCVYYCTDQACYDSCAQAYPNGVLDLQTLDSCSVDNCQATCVATS
jgi:hypothetical protein